MSSAAPIHRLFRFLPAIGSFVCTLLWVTCSAFAQETTGTLEGHVLDSEGKPIPYVAVSVTGTQLQGTRGTMSLNSGYFRVSALPLGEYEVTLSHISYQPITFEKVSIRLGQTTDLGTSTLVDQVHEMEPIVVTGRRPLVDPAATYSGYNLASEEFENLPIERDYQTMALLLPHVNETYEGDTIVGNGVTFNGGTELENRFYIEGVDVTEPFWGANAMPLPYNFVREVRIRSGAYEAEYRSSLGGVLDVVTHSGSNELHGEVFGHYIDNNLSGGSRLSVGEPPQGDFDQFDLGFGVGGPIQKDRLWYFAAFNAGRVNEDVQIPGLEARPDETRNYRIAGKLNWSVNDKNDLVLSAIGAPTRRDAVGNWVDAFWTPVTVLQPETYLYEQKTTPYLVSLEGNHFLSDVLYLESSISLFKHKYEEVPPGDPAELGPMYMDTETGTWSGGWAGSLINDYRTTSVGLKGTMLSDNHTWKAGLEYRDIMGSQTGDGGYIGRIVDESGSESWFWFSYFTVLEDKETGSRNPSAFLQDSWRVNRHLRLNLGVRWDGQFMIDSNGDVAQKLLDQWQPRTGFVYLFGNNDSRKIHGSFGRYYQDLGVLFANSVFNEAGGYRWTNYDHDPRLDPSGGTDVFNLTGTISDPIDGLQGQYYDEFTLGYEQGLQRWGKAGIRGIYQTLRRGIEDVWPEGGDRLVGNPGYGELSDWPKMQRDYTALEFTYQLLSSREEGLLVSYVLSKTYGNYPGLFATDYHQSYPNLSLTFDSIESTIDATGRLPGDRPHVLKLNGWYQFGFGLVVGVNASWMSGTPLNDFGAVSDVSEEHVFLVPRGEAGRTPSIWDLGFRFAYDIPMRQNSRVQPKVLMDVLHVGSPREAVAVDQKHFFGVDGSSPNPTYGEPTRFQAPMAVRLGLQMGF